MTDRNEALSARYTIDFTTTLDGGKAAVITDTVTQCGLYLYSDRDSLTFGMVEQQAERIAELELRPAFAQLASDLAEKLAATEAERDQLRAEVERLRPNAERYEWLRDNLESEWAICEWQDDPDGLGYYRDARAPEFVDATIDQARTTHKEEG